MVIILLSAMLKGCSSSPEIPPWFDAIERVPVHTVLVNEQRIAYLDVGQGSPVILIHGLGGSMWQWEYQQTPLAAHHRVITLDVLGSGLSDKPDIDYRPDELVTFFRGFMDRLEIERATLVGNSLGAGLAIGMALSHPDRVDRLVLIGGLPDHVADKLTSPMIKSGIDTQAPTWLVSFGNWLFGRSLTGSILKEIVHDPNLLTPAVLDRSYRNRQRPGTIAPLLAVGRNVPLWEAGYAKRLGEIRHSTLVIWGAEDRVFPPSVGRTLQTVIPGSRFREISNAGHIPQWEQPHVVNPLLLDFMKP